MTSSRRKPQVSSQRSLTATTGKGGLLEYSTAGRSCGSTASSAAPSFSGEAEASLSQGRAVPRGTASSAALRKRAPSSWFMRSALAWR